MPGVHQPQRRVEITQPTRGLFDIRLLQTNRRAESCMTGFALSPDNGEKVVHSSAPVLFQSLLQRVVQPLVPRQKTVVHQRSSQVRIVQGRGNAITNGTKTVANRQSGVP